MSSDTPRTDGKWFHAAAVDDDVHVVHAEFAEQLERELSAAQSQLAAARLDSRRLDRLERALRNEYVTFGYSERNHFWLDEMNGQSMTDGDTLRAAIDALPKQQEKT